MNVKLLFAGQNFNFVDELITLFENDPNFLVKCDKWLGHDKHDIKASWELLNWADLIIANWCLGNAVWYSQKKRSNQRLFIRFHRFEINTKYPKMLNLQNVDKLIFVSPIFQKQFERTFPLSKEKSIFIYNPINTCKFKLKKQKGAEFNLGMLGYHRTLKRPDKVIEIFESLKQRDNRFKLFLKGYPPEKVEYVWSLNEERQYFESLFNRIQQLPYKNDIVFEEHSENIQEWFKKIGFVLSTSDVESFHCAVAEGMSSGSLPMITGWKGADLIYPKEFVKENIDEIVDSILSYAYDKEQYSIKQKEAWEYGKNFDLKLIYSQFKKLFLDTVIHL